MEPVLDWLCHRHPDRCLVVPDVAPWVVCARCTGIWIGALVATAAWGVARGWSFPVGTVRLFIAALALIAVVATPLEVVGERLGWWLPGNALRYALGLACGVSLAGVLLASIGRPAADWWRLRWSGLVVIGAGTVLGTAPWWPRASWASTVWSLAAIFGLAALSLLVVVAPTLAWARWRKRDHDPAAADIRGGP